MANDLRSMSPTELLAFTELVADSNNPDHLRSTMIELKRRYSHAIAIVDGLAEDLDAADRVAGELLLKEGRY